MEECLAYQWQQRASLTEPIARPEFSIEKEDCLLLHLLRLVFHLQLDYISIITSILRSLNRHFLRAIQLFILKNRLLHFLI
jgi:hypothetical protein